MISAGVCTGVRALVLPAGVYMGVRVLVLPADVCMAVRELVLPAGKHGEDQGADCPSLSPTIAYISLKAVITLPPLPPTHHSVHLTEGCHHTAPPPSHPP